jgi:Protein of unknown function (DUF1236)
MKNTKHALLMSVAAAALIAGAGFGVSVASAQAPPSPTTQQNAPPTAQQNVPAEKTGHEPKAAVQNKAPDTGVKSGKVDEKMERKSGQNDHAQDNTKPDAKPLHAQDNKPDAKPMHSETKFPGKVGAETQAEPQKKTDMKGPEKTGDAKVGAKDQGAAGGSVKLSAEQHTTMRAAIKQHNARPMTNVNFSISVGSRVPRSVHFYRMPDEMVYYYPHWRGYDYFLVGDEIFVVNPRTHEIVAILDA